MSTPVPRRLLILHNPFSGRDRTRHLSAVLNGLQRAGASIHIEAPSDFSNLALLAADAQSSGAYDAIVAAGGDGTIRVVASALAGTATPLGVIPLGTANVLASELGLPRHPDEIAHMLMLGRETTIECGLADGVPFLLMAGAGFDAAVLTRLDHAWKHKVGKLAYVGPMLGELAQRPLSFGAVIDGQRLTCNWLIVANASHYAGKFLLTPGRDMTSPGFDAVVVTAPTRLRLLGVLLAIAGGRLTGSADVMIVRCQEVQVPASEHVPIQIDGDLCRAPALHIGAKKVPLKLIVPLTTNAALPAMM